MARGDVVIRIRADYTDKDLDRAIRDVNRLKTESAGAGPAMAGLGRGFAAAGAALAGMVGIQEITQFLKDSAQAAIEDEKSMRSLAQAMTNVGLTGQIPEIEAGIDRLSRMFGVADDKLRPAFQQLALVTEDVTESQKLLSLAMDISAGTGRDLESVTQALAKAASGQTTALGRLGVGLGAALLKSKDMDAITAELSRKFGGQAATAADTFGGKMAKISVAVDEAKERIGYELLSALDNVTSAMLGPNGAVNAIDTMGEALADLVRQQGLAATGFAGIARSLLDLIPGVDRSTISFNGLLIKLLDMLGPAGTVIKTLMLLGLQNEYGTDSSKAWTSATVQAGIAAGKAAPGIRDLASATLESADAAYAAAGSYMAFWQSVLDKQRVERDLKNTSGTVSSAIAQGLAMGDTGEAFWDRIRGSIDKASSSGGGARVVDTITQAQARILAAANKKLVEYNATNAPFGEAAMSAAESFATSFDYGTGPFAEKAKGLVDSALAAVRSKVTEAQQVGKEITDGLTGQLSLAEALETAKQTGGSIVDAFVAQGEKIKQFAENIKKLTAAGLSQEAVQEIVSAGYQRGGEIADAMISGNIAENVRRANEVYTSVNTVAKQTGDQAAAIFGQSGIKMALDMMTALIEVLSGKKGKAWKDLQDAMSALAASLSREILLTRRIVDVGGGGGGGGDGIGSPTPITDYRPPTAGAEEGAPGSSRPFPVPVIPEFGTGGKPPREMYTGGFLGAGQLALVGERGPELFQPTMSGRIIPNDQLGGGNTYNITVQAGVGDPREIGRQVVEAIKSFERASGPVFVNA